MSKHFLFALLAVLFSVLPARAETIVVAADATWPPFEMLDENKQVTGYGPDYIRAAAREAGLEADVRNVAWDGIFAALGSNQCDAIASSVTITPERQATMAFTKPYFENYQALVVLKDSPVQKLSDLKGKTVGGQIGTTGILYTQRLNDTQDLGAKVKTYDEVGLAMEDLKNGRIDAVMCDDRVAKFYAERKAGYAENMRVAFITDEVEYFGFALRKQDTALLEKLNQGIDAVKAKGIEEQLQAKWLGNYPSPVPLRGDRADSIPGGSSCPMKKIPLPFKTLRRSSSPKALPYPRTKAASTRGSSSSSRPCSS